MFASAALARRIEHAVASDLGQAAVRAGGFTLPVGGGTAIFAGPESPLTKVVGLDLEVAALATVEARFNEHGAAVTVELPSLAEPSLLQALSEAGYDPDAQDDDAEADDSEPEACTSFAAQKLRWDHFEGRYVEDKPFEVDASEIERLIRTLPRVP